MREEPKSVRKAGRAGTLFKGPVGLAFTIAFIVVMMLSVPALRWFFVLSIPPGLAIAAILRSLNRGQDGRNLDAPRFSRDNLDEHPGIRIHKIPVKSWAGLVFAVGVMVLFLVALPAIRWFFLLAIPIGLTVAVVLYYLHRR